MNRSTAAVLVALALWSVGCGVTAESDGSAADRSDTAVVDEFAGEKWEEDLSTTEEPADDEGSDGDETSEDDGSSGVSESDEGSEEGSDGESDGSDASGGPAEEGSDAEAPAGGAAPGVYVAPEGGVENGYGLRFEVSDDGSVLHSLEADVLESCDGSSTTNTVTVGADLAWDIVDGQFSARYEEDMGGGTLYTTLEGSFSGTMATGTIRQESVVAGSVCDTYALEFTAELT